MAFVVPSKFLRNAGDVLKMGPPADVGASLMKYMCQRLGVSDLGGLDVLDFGCGSRFADAIINRAVAVKSYTGVDTHRSIVRFLQKNAVDRRLSFHHLNAYNPTYNKRGVPMTADTRLPLAGRDFDVICMFSVITHQLPQDASAIFKMLRRHMRSSGRLFFSVDLEDDVDGYGERYPASPTLLSLYSPDLLRTLLDGAQWRILSIEPKDPGGLPIMDSVLCEPA